MVGRFRAGRVAEPRPRRLSPGRRPRLRPLPLAGRRGQPERDGAALDRGSHLRGRRGGGSRTIRNPVLGGMSRPRDRARGARARRRLVRHAQDCLHRRAPRPRRRVPPDLPSDRLPALLGVERAAPPASAREARGDPAPAGRSRSPGLLRGGGRPLARRRREAARGADRARGSRRGGGPHPPNRCPSATPVRRSTRHPGSPADRASSAPSASSPSAAPRRRVPGPAPRRTSRSRTPTFSPPPTRNASRRSATMRKPSRRPAPPI